MAGRRLFQDVADKIVALIDEGVFPPGTRLPGERELSERFNVSRVTVREAEIALQATGRIVIKTGSGVYVSEDVPTDKLPEVSAFELTEARSLFESEAAAIAAPIISDEDIAILRRLLDEMARDDANDDEHATDVDRQFHLTIAAASGNKAIIHVVNSLWRLRMELPAVRDTHASVCHHDGAIRQREHAAIVDALARHDSAAARLAMRQHFSRLLEAMLDATEQREIKELQNRAAASRARFLMSAQLN